MEMPLAPDWCVVKRETRRPLCCRASSSLTRLLPGGADVCCLRGPSGAAREPTRRPGPLTQQAPPTNPREGGSIRSYRSRQRRSLAFLFFHRLPSPPPLFFLPLLDAQSSVAFSITAAVCCRCVEKSLFQFVLHVKGIKETSVFFYYCFDFPYRHFVFDVCMVTSSSSSLHLLTKTG